MLNIEEKGILKDFIEDYIFDEIIGSVLSSLVFIILSVGLFYSSMVDFVTTPNILHMIYFILSTIISIILIYLCIWNGVNLRKNSKILKSEDYKIIKCISESPTVHMNRGKKDVEILCQYRDSDGVLSKKSYRAFSKDKNFTTKDCEGKESYFIEFTDDLSFIMIK